MDDYENIEEELSQTTQNYFISQLSQSNEEYLTITSFKEEDYNCLKTEPGLQNQENIEVQNSNNSEEILNPSQIKNLTFNERHNPFENKIKKEDKKENLNYSSTTLTNKKRKRGRRDKNSTETGGHTSQDKDNIIRKYWVLFINSILALANSLSKPYNLTIRPTNFAEQFGPSIIENEDFIKLKVYKYFTYNKIFKDDKTHKKIGTINAEVIKTMVSEKKDETYIALMKSSIEYMYNQHIKNIKKIEINGKYLPIPNFKTINDIVKEVEDLKGKDDEIKEDFKKKATSLVDYIINDGKKIKRKTEKTKIKEYNIIIPELE